MVIRQSSCIILLYVYVCDTPHHSTRTQSARLGYEVMKNQKLTYCFDTPDLESYAVSYTIPAEWFKRWIRLLTIGIWHFCQSIHRITFPHVTYAPFPTRIPLSIFPFRSNRNAELYAIRRRPRMSSKAVAIFQIRTEELNKASSYFVNQYAKILAPVGVDGFSADAQIP